jgi:N-methylhydantoinase B
MLDWSESSEQNMYGVNLVYHHTLALAHQCLMCAIWPQVRDNEGSYRPLRQIAPEGSIMNASYPAAVMARHLTGFYIPSAVFGCLEKAGWPHVVADSAAVSNFGVISEDDKGQQIFAITTCLGGMGARPNMDSPTTLFPFVISDIPIEIIETEFPLYVKKREMIQDSGGPGKYRGGLGQSIIVRVESRKPAVFHCMQERINHPPLGFRGALPGSRAALVINEKIRPHPKKGYILNQGDEVRINSNGGGGFWPPEERDPGQVLEDVLDEYVSVAAARKHYKVAVDKKRKKINEAATRKLRGTGNS